MASSHKYLVFGFSNGLRLGEGGDFHHKYLNEGHTSNLRKTVIRSTKSPLLPNRCYGLVVLSKLQLNP